MNNDTHKIEIEDWYEHKHEPSVFIMFTKEYEVIWCFSGNAFRTLYLQNPDDFISGPIEVPITPALNTLLTTHIEELDYEE